MASLVRPFVRGIVLGLTQYSTQALSVSLSLYISSKSFIRPLYYSTPPGSIWKCIVFLSEATLYNYTSATIRQLPIYRKYTCTCTVLCVYCIVVCAVV